MEPVLVAGSLSVRSAILLLTKKQPKEIFRHIFISIFFIFFIFSLNSKMKDCVQVILRKKGCYEKV